MNAQVAALRLWIETRLWRHGAALGVAWAGVAVLAALLATRLVAVRESPPTEPPGREAAVPAPSPVREVQRRLAAAPSTVVALRQIGAAAQQAGIATEQGDYQHSEDKSFPGGPLVQTRVTLPVKASYPQVKAWVYAVLRELPSATLDQISLRREDDKGDQLDGTVVFSLWSLPAAGEQP